MKKCPQCNRELSIDNYYNPKKQAICKDCHRANIRHTYQIKVDKINEYKSKRGCRKCGDKRFYVLDFHHSDPNEKEFAISDKIRNKFETLLPEMEKCDILCANCHREWHYVETQGIDYNAWLGEKA